MNSLISIVYIEVYTRKNVRNIELLLKNNIHFNF